MPDNISSKSPGAGSGWVMASTAKGRSWLRRSGIAGQLVSLAIVAAIFTIGTGGKFLSAANLQVILSLAAIPAIIAIGLHQVVVCGGIDLSVEGVVALCVVCVGFLAHNKVNSNDVGLWIVPIIVGFGGIAGIVNGLLNTKLKIPSFISTLGMSWVLWGLAVFVSKGQTIPLL
jgi:ribose/xylose/arabinose/galactoside ABC-type transport system permease subunit